MEKSHISSYTKYLPPVLWSLDNDPSQFLGRMLCIFEQILTGIPEDTEEITNYEPLDKTIDNLSNIFNPWRTPAKFLPWLASWVSLSLQEDWSEYQKRKFIFDMMSIYQQRGLKKGLLTYLDIYASTTAKPRIAIDDGEAIFRAKLDSDGTAQLHAFAYSHTISNAGSEISVLLHPTAIAVDHNEQNIYYIVADQGSKVEAKWKPALWKIQTTGEISYKDSSPVPIYSGDILKNPVAVVVASSNQYYVLIQGEDNTQSKPAIYRFNSNPQTISAQPILVINNLATFEPVDMVLDTTNTSQRRFFVLDQGDSNDTNPAKILVITEGVSSVESHSFSTDTITAPTALTIDKQGRLIIADSRREDDSRPADLNIVDPRNNWSVTSLLQNVTDNPLICPTGLVFENSNSLIVCDTGLRGSEASTSRTEAEPAAIYRINLSQTPPLITKITKERKLVNPSKITIDPKGDLIIADAGEYNEEEKQDWRARDNEFGVVVLFSEKRPTEVEERNQIRFGIEKVINEQKPAHTFWSMNSAV